MRLPASVRADVGHAISLHQRSPCRSLAEFKSKVAPAMELDTFTLVGIVGTALIIVAYLATQQGWITAEDWRYQLANLVGAILILLSLVTAWNLPVAIIESFWAVISVYGLVRTAVRRTEQIKCADL